MHRCKAFWTKFNFSASAHLLTNTLKADTEPYERDAECFFSPHRVSERATVQVPTGSHSQTVVTGWSNYWAVDTPAWRGFISSRKGDSQITVYPHPTPSSGLILQLQNGEATHRHSDTVQSHACAHTLILKISNFAALFRVCVCVCTRAGVSSHASTEPSLPVKHTYLNHQSVWNDSIMQVCVRRGATERIGETDDTRVLFNLHPPPFE